MRSADTEGMVISPAIHHAEHAAKALLDARRPRAHHILLRRDVCDGEALAIIEPGRAVRSTMPLGELIETLALERVRFETSFGVCSEPWTVAPRHFESLDRLGWLLGERCAREHGLLPWLSARQRYRLLAWPDFGEIGLDTHGATLCGHLSREALSLREAALRLDWPEPLAAALFNALALCGVLVADEQRKPISQRGSLAQRHTVGSPEPHTIFGDLWHWLKA